METGRLTREEYDKITRRVHDRRKVTITGSYGVYDVYKWLRKNKWLDIGRPLKEAEFYRIIRRYHELLGEVILSGVSVYLPARMGMIELRRKPRIVSLIDGKVVTNLPIDWNSTINLWYEDEECRNNHVILHKEKEGDMHNLVYSNFESNYPNKSFFEMRFGRTLMERKKRKEATEGLNSIFLLRKRYSKL